MFNAFDISWNLLDLQSLNILVTLWHFVFNYIVVPRNIILKIEVKTAYMGINFILFLRKWGILDFEYLQRSRWKHISLVYCKIEKKLNNLINKSCNNRDKLYVLFNIYNQKKLTELNIFTTCLNDLLMYICVSMLAHHHYTENRRVICVCVW